MNIDNKPPVGNLSDAPSTLGYRIISCSSEDPNYPISTIQSSSIRSNGWQSSPNPRYPIEIIIDLGSPAEIDTIQFVSHQIIQIKLVLFH